METDHYHNTHPITELEKLSEYRNAIRYGKTKCYIIPRNVIMLDNKIMRLNIWHLYAINYLKIQ